MIDYDFSKYTMADICEELFCLTDALDDEDMFCEEERIVLAKLRKQFYKLCKEGDNKE